MTDPEFGLERRRRVVRVSRLGVVVPAHKEEDLICGCLDALARASAHPRLSRVHLRVAVVLDSCRDATAELCRKAGVETLTVGVRNVGVARATGYNYLARTWADQVTNRRQAGTLVWLASTDADTRVAPDWFVVQLDLADGGADATFGVVDVDTWSGHPAAVPAMFAGRYTNTGINDPLGHPHVHGANMGFRLSAYDAVGGFAPLAVGEDQDLSDRFDTEPGITVVRTPALRVTTSSRTAARAAGGFADLLRAFGTHSTARAESLNS